MQQRIPQLDSLRGIAILMVLVGHIQKNVPGIVGPWAHHGFSGVDLFFVLSGFLITGILLRAKTRPDYFKNFYTRRALRIWPLYYAVLILLLLPNSLTHLNLASPRWSYLLYIQNLFPGFPAASGPLYITWSLAIEEQFYLIWPPIVLLLNRQWLARLAISLVILSPVLRYALPTSVPTYSLS